MLRRLRDWLAPPPPPKPRAKPAHEAALEYAEALKRQKVLDPPPPPPSRRDEAKRLKRLHERTPTL